MDAAAFTLQSITRSTRNGRDEFVLVTSAGRQPLRLQQLPAARSWKPSKHILDRCTERVVKAADVVKTAMFPTVWVRSFDDIKAYDADMDLVVVLNAPSRALITTYRPTKPKEIAMWAKLVAEKETNAQ